MSRGIEPIKAQLTLPNGQVVNSSTVHSRVRALALRALAIQSTVIAQGPANVAQWMRWQMTETTLNEFAENPVSVAGLMAFSFQSERGPELFGLPIVLIEQLDGEVAAWGCYLAIAA